MIVPINIDLSGVVEEFSLNEEQSVGLSSYIIDRITEEYTLKWENLVDTQLKQSRGEYKRAMFVARSVTNGSSEVTFSLSERESPLAMMVEEGSSPFDLKEVFQKSPKAKKKLDGGWYITIPYRHSSSRAIAESSVFASTMPKEIYNIAKKKSPVTYEDLPEEHRVLGVRREIQLPTLIVPEYTHKKPLYEGLVKIDVSTGNKTESNYYTFRRVSDKSDPNSWWHKGIEAKKLMNKALDVAQIDKVTDMAIDTFLNDVLG